MAHFCFLFHETEFEEMASSLVDCLALCYLPGLALLYVALTPNLHIGGEHCRRGNLGYYGVLFERWEAADNVQDDGMMLLLAQDESYLEVLCAPCGPFQFRGDRLETPEGEIHRGQARTEVVSVFGEPLRISDAPEMGSRFSHEGYERRDAFGSVVARITVTYRETEVHSLTITREERSREFQRAHGHKFLNLEE